MAVGTGKTDEMPIVKDLKDFDQKSGNILERLIFNNRMVVMIACIAVTLLLAYQGSKLVFNASFEKMLPQSHPYIKNYLANKGDLRGLGNSIRVVVENTSGDIFDPEYLDLLRQINDELVLTPGVDRAWVKSIWTPVVRWTEVTEEGFQGGPVMPDNFDGSEEKVAKLKPVDGFCAEFGAAITLFGSSAFGIPVSTTHTITGAIMGVGSLRRLSAVKWGVAGKIVWAWILTIPCSAVISALSYMLVRAVFHKGPA